MTSMALSILFIISLAIRHLLCLWHVGRKQAMNLGKLEMRGLSAKESLEYI